MTVTNGALLFKEYLAICDEGLALCCNLLKLHPLFSLSFSLIHTHTHTLFILIELAVNNHNKTERVVSAGL